MSARGHVSRLVRAAAAMAIACVAVMCGDVKVGPDGAIAIEFPPPQLPSLVKGDQLRDTLGHIDSLRAFAFNSSGDTIQNAPIRYMHADTLHILGIDSVTGHVMGLDTGFARFVAQTATLQSAPETLFVVERPTEFLNVTNLDDTLDFTPVRADTLFPLTVTLHAGSHPVDHYRVEYSFVSPADLNTPDSTRVLLTDETRNFSLVDTTGAATAGNGAATRYLRISAFAHPGFSDTVVVEARAFLPDHTPVSGSPLRFRVFVQIH